MEPFANLFYDITLLDICTYRKLVILILKINNKFLNMTFIILKITLELSLISNEMLKIISEIQNITIEFLYMTW